MNQTSSGNGASAVAGVPRTSERPGSGLRSSLQWLGRKLSGLVRWVAKQLRAPLQEEARARMQSWVAKHVPAPLRWLGRLFDPDRERGFGFWWLVATLGIALVLGLVVALLLTPVAGLIALLVVAIWALVRRGRHKRHEREERTSRASARDVGRDGRSDASNATIVSTASGG
jgi:lysylphosphatidylglycerol synthetase-like protein (DUF2156 family)